MIPLLKRLIWGLLFDEGSAVGYIRGIVLFVAMLSAQGLDWPPDWKKVVPAAIAGLAGMIRAGEKNPPKTGGGE